MRSGSRTDEMQMLWTNGGVHACLHIPHSRHVLREMDLWTLRRSRERRIPQIRQQIHGDGGSSDGAHGFLQHLQTETPRLRAVCKLFHQSAGFLIFCDICCKLIKLVILDDQQKRLRRMTKG
uniref:Uncharacterized protein n=1 Tax=Picea sitchensis TaxID=3332 RepID=B8LMZ9_PICSI|nr:unknown [Picea sitchensis]